MKVFEKDDLYKRTGWFSRDCEMLLENLRNNNLVVVDKNDLQHMVELLNRNNDDLK